MECEIESHYGARLKRRRLQAGISQQEMAARCGLTQAAICRYELGHRSPSLRIATRLARSLGLEISELLRGDG